MVACLRPPCKDRAGGGGALAPLTFSDGKIFFFTLVTQICHLPHEQGLVI